MGRKQFDVPKHVLDIVYSQTICWLAVFYAPLFLLATVLKTIWLYVFRMFYIRAVMLYVKSFPYFKFKHYFFQICSPSSLPYSAARASSLFKYCLLLSFSLVVVAVGFSQSEVTTRNFPKNEKNYFFASRSSLRLLAAPFGTSSVWITKR